MCWSLSAPIVGAIGGEDAAHSLFWSMDGPLFRHLCHGGLERYDSLRRTLDFPAFPPVGMWAPPVFEPS